MTEQEQGIGTDEMRRIMLEEALGKPPKRPDTPQEAEFRESHRKFRRWVESQGPHAQVVIPYD